jgi:hypothetical protein
VSFAVTYAEDNGRWESQFLEISRAGSVIGPSPITNVNSDTFSGPIIWADGVYATAWEDRRDDDFEIYFNLLNSAGEKLRSDLRLSNSAGFSLGPSVLWTGQEFVVIWSDERDSVFRKYGQRVSRDGERIGGNVALTPDNQTGEGGSMALLDGRIGLVYKADGPQGNLVRFRTLSLELGDPSPPLTLSSPNSVAPTVEANGERFIVVWHQEQVVPGDAIWGATVSSDGEILQAERPLTPSASFAASKSLLPLGDRFLLAWAAATNSSYDILMQPFDNDLVPLGEAMPVTQSPGDAVRPILTLGPEGDLGVLWQDHRSGIPQVYFQAVTCLVAP